MNTQLVGTARLVYEPDLKFSQKGLAYCRLRLAFSNSKKKRNSDEYEYTPAIFVDCTVFGGMAENAAESLSKGDEVVAAGELAMEHYEVNGEQREKLVLDRAEIAPSVRRVQVQIKRVQRGSDGQQGNGRSRQPADQRAQVGSTDPWGSSSSSEPPF